MKRFLPFTLLLCGSVSLVSAQDRFAYAITDAVKDGANWSSLRKLDLQTGTFGDIMLNGLDASTKPHDAATKKQMTEPLQDKQFGALANIPFGTGVAAIAFDRKSQRLYYTPMLMDQLRYVDLKTMKVYFVNDAGLTGATAKAADQSNIITRMSIASDGNGYALTNDANSLIRFTTGKKITVTNLGIVTDDPTNTHVSIHNSCSSFGGDMIADDDGNLYVFSARNYVFKINIETKVATLLGRLSEIPEAFTANGVAVAGDNSVWITSAVDNSAVYSVDMKTLRATKVTDGAWKSADLANSNLLATHRSAAIPTLIASTNEISNKQVQLYPNPVVGKQFAVRLNLPEGNYTLSMTDMIGRQSLVQSVINIKGTQTENVQLPASTQNGMYLVRVLDGNGKAIYSKKILVQ
ncbi:T9SS type A sorting domain-containing protein [Terrimonas sp. NA20]|uniref:T9SS type A sorting domain-containing protein n=1 Tax=Terrimonas ginsenosidimutans TaxID=2908004 RepID=A0ABS9KUT3_9BACT|nr:T9SS type A sorting domain-containing protein [Terrimonas ginsenosidimutans]MCG2616109.1 T9SS type A sorting domain-containing protein [Terrimonas ginsenosidimutans]